jgi:aryl sulfotransferase
VSESGEPLRYRSPDEDSGRWVGFPFRDGDIVISTRSKHGTTWMQMICALLVFRTPDLPAPLPDLSPWLDWLGTPRDEVVARLEAQTHRRFVKTHTPLDGVPLDRRATYVVVARHPLDAAVSLYHQGTNLDRARIAELLGGPEHRPAQVSLAAWLDGWVAADPAPRDDLDSLPGVLHHLAVAWDRRDDVVLVHYADLLADLDGEMGRLAALLDLRPPTPDLVAAARFDAMRDRADELAPDAGGVLEDRQAFFRQGGSARGVLPAEVIARYEARATALAPPDLLTWLHRPP